MALSQIQCLDDNHVNPRTHESKPEFFYSEDQRLALEALLRDGRTAFVKYLEARDLRGFLSDPEQENLVGSVEPYDPGSELFSEGAEDNETPLSQHYWPDLSDTSIPQMDLGWPDSEAYRGVTRTTVYAQPPLDGQAHIKEVVRKMIAQAQKVIAVVMDVFTDIDIFRDLIDAGFRRRVSVYILLERTTLPHFLSMCQRANLHPGHLKHLRVRCTDGAEFYTRSCTKVRGRMGHRFMFIDGDKAVSGSYSFTWMSSRLDRNLITVITGQAVEAFDRLFRFLYMSSSSVDLRQVATEPEPEPEPVPQPVTAAPPSAEIARKLYNPKYALVALGNPSSSPTPSTGHNSPKESQETKKKGQRGAIKEAIQEAPPLHPGLTDLEKACLISYLPTWPEPDPPSDVIGFINIRDTSKPIQAGLQRSQMFETSQAIRFSSPLSMPKETLPEVAKLRQPTKHEEMNKRQPTPETNKVEEPVIDGPQATKLKTKAEESEQKSTASELKSEPVKGKLPPSTAIFLLPQPLSCTLSLSVPDLRSPTTLVRSPTPDGYLPCTPTSDSLTNTQDLRPYTPDLRTPTPDGYFSLREDSTPSPTSEEYYECSDSPFHDPVFDRAPIHSHGVTEDLVNSKQTNAITSANSPASINYTDRASTPGPTDRNTCRSETESLSGVASVSPSSSSPQKNVTLRGEEGTANDENIRKQDEKGSLAERSNRTEQDSQVTERRASGEAKKTAGRLKQSKDSTQTVEKEKEAQLQALKKKRTLNKSAAETVVDRGLTAGESTNEGTEPKRLSTHDLKPEKVSSEGEGSDKVAPGLSSVERKDRPQSTKEAEGQKPLHTPVKPLRAHQQQQDSGASSSPRPAQPSRRLSATQASGRRPRASRPLNQAKSNAVNGSLQVVDDTSSPSRPPSRPPPPLVAALKQAKASHS
eukprot:superscaffoldBa00006129_g21178